MATFTSLTESLRIQLLAHIYIKILLVRRHVLFRFKHTHTRNTWWCWVSLTLFNVINGVPHHIGFIIFLRCLLLPPPPQTICIFFCSICVWIKSCVFDVSCSFLSYRIRFTFTRKPKLKELKSLNCTENDEGWQSLNECERKRAHVLVSELKRAGDETFRYAWFGYYEIAGDVKHEFCLRLCVCVCV